MSKMTCMEAVFEVLANNAVTSVAAGDALEHQCFDDVLKGCFALASGESSEPDVPAWIAAHDSERSEFEVCLDICDYFYRYHGTARPSAVMERAIAAGKEAL